jgi:hypothetical protein
MARLVLKSRPMAGSAMPAAVATIEAIAGRARWLAAPTAPARLHI